MTMNHTLTLALSLPACAPGAKKGAGDDDLE